MGFGKDMALEFAENVRVGHEREGHKFQRLRKNHKCERYRGRAALQGRVSRLNQLGL